MGPRRVLAPHTTPGVKGAAGGGGAQEQFWRENIARFEEKDFQALKQLLKVVGGSSDPGTLAVACHDLGCFIHHFPAGKGIVTGGGPPAPPCLTLPGRARSSPTNMCGPPYARPLRFQWFKVASGCGSIRCTLTLACTVPIVIILATEFFERIHPPSGRFIRTAVCRTHHENAGEGFSQHRSGAGLPSAAPMPCPRSCESHAYFIERRFQRRASCAFHVLSSCPEGM